MAQITYVMDYNLSDNVNPQKMYSKYGLSYRSERYSEVKLCLRVCPSRIFSIEDWDVFIFMLIHYLPCHVIIQIIVEYKLLS